MTDVCARCHNEQVQKISAAVAHPPAKDNPCTMCHAPHGAEYAGLLNSPEATLCDSCHGLDDLITKKTGADSKAIAGEPLIHKPVADRKCGECHDPHGSNAKGLLVRQGERLCYGCHTQEKISFADGNSHKPVAEGKCGACHAPHGTDGTDLVKTDEKVLCTQCHDLGTPTALAAHRRFDVANAKCTICHDPHVSKGDHLLKRYTHKPFTEGSCESCHEDGGGKAAGQVSPGACVTCHDGKPAEKGHQQMAGVACADCHAPHASSYEALLLNPAKLCAGCHADVIRPKGQEAGAVHLHRPVQDGSCMACHEMHEPKAANLLAEPPRQLCGGCHETIKARANHLTQHEPFRKEQCSSCHSTHASTEKHLMKAGESAVCGSCHKPDDQKMKVAHKRVPPSGDTCTSCHDPHSTAAKGSALVRRVRHAPYEENDCSVCHAETGKPSLSLSTCLECHDSADRFAAVHTGGHASKEGSQVLACLDCHSPHAGYKGLLPRESQTQTCMQCHDRNEFSRRFVHEALSDGCTTCHDVHKENMKELKGPAGIALCTQCHDAAKTHSHPYGEKYTDPRDNGPLTCTSCHMPHSSDHEFMLQFDRNRDLCVQCHLPGTMKVH